MSEFYYSTDSEEHLIDIGEKQEPQWDALTDWELAEELSESFNEKSLKKILIKHISKTS